MPRKLIYLAAPLFTLLERDRNLLLASTLENFCDVFLPQRDGALLPDLLQQGLPVDQASHVVYNRDRAAVERCDAVVGVLDGADVDSGVAFELGYACALNKVCTGYRTKVCIGYRTDFRLSINPMLLASMSHRFSSLYELTAWVQDWSAR